MRWLRACVSIVQASMLSCVYVRMSRWACYGRLAGIVHDRSHSKMIHQGSVLLSVVSMDACVRVRGAIIMYTHCWMTFVDVRVRVRDVCGEQRLLLVLTEGGHVGISHESRRGCILTCIHLVG